MIMKNSIAYKIWLLSLKIEDLRFRYFLKKPQDVQLNILKKYLNDNKNTSYGKRYSFSKIKSIKDFQDNIPIIKFSDIQHYIDDLSEGVSNVLSKKKLLFFEETTGSENSSKLIPYNKSLKQEFISAIGPWISSLNRNFPGIFLGRSYWSISPSLKEKRVASSGHKIGLESDAAYLNRTGGLLFKYLLITINNENSSEEFYKSSLKKMVREDRLGFISVYSPSFLIQLNNVLRRNWDEIVPNSSSLNKDSLWSDIFKNVKLISCWLDSTSAQFESEIKSFIGNIPLQAKGLLSTEGIVSIPFLKAYDPVLAITSHFFEFESQKDNKIYLAHELNLYESYEVILSTGNGIMRYRTNDIVEVTNYIKNTPAVKFIGRKSSFSDLVGEKISEVFCLNILEQLEKKFEVFNYRAFFYVNKNQNRFNYNFAIYSSNKSLKIQDVNSFLILEFNKNPYYSQAIKLNQINNIQTIFISKEKYDKLMSGFFKSKRIKEGNRKPPVLFNLNNSIKLFSKN